MILRYATVCSGIEAPSVAWHPLGWKPVFFSEIEKFPSQILKHHYPEVPNLGDMTKFEDWSDYAVDVFCGGTPCQSFSVAGLRKGLADPRGNLMLTYLAIAKRYRPRWLVWENVPGVLSSNSGRDFGTFLGGLGECGYGFAYRILDAQFFGVAQRRRRVFVIGHLGDWRPAAAVLFERESLSGNPAPRRETGESAAAFTASSFGNYGEGVGTLRSNGGDLGGGSETLIASTGQISHCLNAGGMGRQDFESETLITHAYGIQANIIGRQPENGGNGNGFSDEVAPTLTKSDRHGIAFGVGESSEVAHCLRSRASRADKHESTTYVAIPINTQLGLRGADTSNTNREGVGIGNQDDPAFTLQRSHHHAVQFGSAVRRLTPIECERLQGFPDNYTLIPKAADGPRYKALGNSMAVPVMRWIGERIAAVENIISHKKRMGQNDQ